MSKDDTLWTAEKAFDTVALHQLEPRVLHKIVVQELSRMLAQGLQEKLGALYAVQPTGLRGMAARYPAYSEFMAPDDAVKYGIQLHIMSKAELKGAIDAATKDLKGKHALELAVLDGAQKARVKEEAKRLLEKAAL